MCTEGPAKETYVPRGRREQATKNVKKSDIQWQYLELPCMRNALKEVQTCLFFVDSVICEIVSEFLERNVSFVWYPMAAW